MRYVFVKKINETNETGIVELESLKAICLCDEKNSKLILKALKLNSVSNPTCCDSEKNLLKNFVEF